MSLCEYCYQKSVVSVGNAIDFYNLCIECFKSASIEERNQSTLLSEPLLSSQYKSSTILTPRELY